MAVGFRLLGDVQADVDGRPVDLGHARQRCVLAALLVDANRAVPTDDLVARVWGSRRPQRAHGALYSYVSRLRRALLTGEARIVRQGGGYALTVDALAVDLHRFRQLTFRARAAGTPAAALTLYDQALGLWRGEAFAGVDTAWLATVREDLHRQRRAAELDRTDVALALGRHAELLPDLLGAAARSPLDERLAGQLMVALYRAGRQADALAHYHRVRLRLAEGLGTDPSPQLRQLHQRILVSDPALTAMPRATGHPADRAVPRQLPAPPPSFAGRADQLARLDALLALAARPAAVVISAVSGMAGVGKTALAVHWAHQRCDRFPDGQLYLNLRGFDPTGQVLDPGNAVRQFLDALGVPPHQIPADPQAQAALYRSRLAGRRMVVVLDNARDAAQVRPLMPGTPGCLVLVTSRNQLAGLVATDGAHPLALDLLSTAESRELLTHRLGAARVAAEPEAVDELIAHCARLPLALAIVAARAATQPHLPLHDLACQLRDEGGRLDTLTTGDPQTDLRTVFSWSQRALTPAAARLFRLLSVHPGPTLSVAAAASLAALPPARVRGPLTELLHANLITEHVPGRYTVHDLLRSHAAQLATDNDRRAATRRLVDHYLHTAHACDRLLAPGRNDIELAAPEPGVAPEQPADHAQAFDWFVTEHRVLLAVVDHAATSGLDRHAWLLARTLWTYLYRQAHWHDLAASSLAALGAADRLADPAAQGAAYRPLAYAYTQLGRLDDAQAHLHRALDLYRGTGDQGGQAHAHQCLAYLWERRSQPDRALDHAEQALRLYRAAGHRGGQAEALNQVGWYHALGGHHRPALRYCEQALALHQDLGNRDGQNAAWDSLGYAHHHLGDHTEAIACYRNALNLSRDLGDRYHEAETLTHLGDTHHATGDRSAACDNWKHALAILDDLDHPDADQLRRKIAALGTA